VERTGGKDDDKTDDESSPLPLHRSSLEWQPPSSHEGDNFFWMYFVSLHETAWLSNGSCNDKEIENGARTAPLSIPEVDWSVVLRLRGGDCRSL